MSAAAHQLGILSRLLATLLALVAHQPATIDPPVPPALADTDPLVRAAVQEQIDAVESSPTADTWLALAETLDANNFVAEAETSYEQVVALAPESARAWYLLAIVRHDLGDLDGAIKALDQAAAKDADYAPIRWRKAYMLLDDGRVDEAAKLFEQVSSEEPAQFGLARVALARRDAPEAWRLLVPLTRDGRNMRYAHRLMAAVYAMTGESDKAALSMHIGAGAAPSWTDPWLADVIKRRTGYDALLDRIRDLTDTGRNDEAVALVNQLLADRPDDLALLNFLGYAHVNAGRRTQGIEIWQDALQRHPDSYLLHLNLGSLGAEDALRAGVPTDDAMRHLDTAITLNPAHARSFEVRGTLHAILGNTANAIDDLERAFALDPTAPNVARQLTQLYLRESRWTDAERVLQRWMLLEPGSPQARLSFAITLMNQDRFDEARQAINEGAQMLPPDHPQVRALREELDRRRHR